MLPGVDDVVAAVRAVVESEALTCWRSSSRARTRTASRRFSPSGWPTTAREVRKGRPVCVVETSKASRRDRGAGRRHARPARRGRRRGRARHVRSRVVAADERELAAGGGAAREAPADEQPARTANVTRKAAELAARARDRPRARSRRPASSPPTTSRRSSAAARRGAPAGSTRCSPGSRPRTSRCRRVVRRSTRPTASSTRTSSPTLRGRPGGVRRALLGREGARRTARRGCARSARTSTSAPARSSIAPRIVLEDGVAIAARRDGPLRRGRRDRRARRFGPSLRSSPAGARSSAAASGRAGT